MDKIIYIIVLCAIFTLGSCTAPQYKPLDFMTVFNAYKWTGKRNSKKWIGDYFEEHKEERHARIMKLIDDYEAEDSYTGIDSVPQNLFDLGPLYYRYIAKCTGVKFEHLEFAQTSDNHYGIAYFGEIEDPKNEEASIDDKLMIYFPDSLSAIAFIEDAVKHGFERADYKGWAEYKKINPSDNHKADSLFLENFKHAAGYNDRKHSAIYSFGIIPNKDKNIVRFSWTY